MKKTRSLSMLLAILMLSAATCGVVSCGSDANPDTTTNNPPRIPTLTLNR